MSSIQTLPKTGWALILLNAFGAGLYAESAQPHAPLSRNFEVLQRSAREEMPSRKFRLPELVEKRLGALSADERKPSGTGMAMKAGVHRQLGDDLNLYGRWDITPDGRHVWRVRVQSPDAGGMRFHIRGFHAGAGMLWLHDGAGREPEILGPYAGGGPYGDGEFWTDVVMADAAVLEYEPARAPRSPIEPPPFVVVEISHVLQGGLPGHATQNTPVSCHLDASCYPEWASTAKSVGRMVYEKDGNSYFCSGTLLATQNQSGIPYFLTADHCISSDAVARTVEVLWLYQSPACNGDRPNERNVPRSLGARYLTSAGLGQGDYSLLRLNSIPDSVMFSGWDTTEPAVGARLTGVHHPAGDYKRISQGTRIVTQGGVPGTDHDHYYSVAYREGRTEGGSSGSGVFVRPGVLVGTLTSGTTGDICRMEETRSNYGRFSTHFPALREYLANASNSGPSNPRPSNEEGSELISGRPAPVRLAAQANAAFYTGMFVRVPAGATSLRIEAKLNGEVGLVLSADKPPTVVQGRASGDYFSEGRTGQETLYLNSRSTPPLKAGTYYLGFANFTVNKEVTGTVTATVETSGGGQTPNPPAAGGGRQLSSGVPATFNFPAVPNPILMNGEQSFRIQVPQGATRLEIRLQTSTPDADLDLFSRFGSDVEVRDGRIEADHGSDSPTGNETIVITPQSTPALRAGVYYISLAVFTPKVATSGTVTATVTGGGGETPPASGNALTFGAPRRFQVPAVDSAALLNGPKGFTIEVPQGATRLELKLNTVPASVDVDLYARFGEDVGANAGRVQADYASEGPDGNETITITAQSNPPLKPGTYYIGFGVFTTNAAAEATITATLSGGGGGSGTPPAPSSGGRVLAPDTTVPLLFGAVDSPTLVNGPRGYAIQVPQGATRLEISLRSIITGFNVDLYVRGGADVTISGGKPVADYVSEGASSDKLVVITPTSNPPLKPGYYYIAFGQTTTGRAGAAALRATIAGGDSGGSGTSSALRSGVASNFHYPAVQGATLFAGEAGFYIDVPAGATKLEVKLDTATAGADLDLYVRQGRDVAVENGRIVADLGSEGPTGSELITISGSSRQPIPQGRYFIGIAVFSTGVAVSGTVKATVTDDVLGRPSGDLPIAAADSQENVLMPDTPVRMTLPAAAVPALYAGPRSFKLTVPEGVTRVKLELKTTTPGADVDLYVRYKDNVELKDGRVVADHAGLGDTGNETVWMDARSMPPLRPGDYHIAVANLAVNAEVQSTLQATFDRTPLPPAQSSARVLEPGAAVRFELPAVKVPSIFLGENAYRINVPAGTERVVIKLRADDIATDVDIYARFGEETGVDKEGNVATDYASVGDTGEEEIVIDNPKAGVYFINLVLYTTGVPVRGSLTATFTSLGGSPAQQLAFAKSGSGEEHRGVPVSAKPAASMVREVSASAKRQRMVTSAPAKQARLKKQVVLQDRSLTVAAR